MKQLMCEEAGGVGRTARRYGAVQAVALAALATLAVACGSDGTTATTDEPAPVVVDTVDAAGLMDWCVQSLVAFAIDFDDEMLRSLMINHGLESGVPDAAGEIARIYYTNVYNKGIDETTPLMAVRAEEICTENESVFIALTSGGS